MIFYPLNGDTRRLPTSRKKKILFRARENVPWARHGPQKNGRRLSAGRGRAGVINYLISMIFNQRSSHTLRKYRTGPSWVTEEWQRSMISWMAEPVRSILGSSETLAGTMSLYRLVTIGSRRNHALCNCLILTRSSLYMFQHSGLE